MRTSTASFLFLLLLLPFFSFGQTHTWTGNGDNYFWEDPLNWDVGTVPLQNGIGTVIIPTGAVVHTTTLIVFKQGLFTGGGTFNNNGALHIIHDSDVNSTKVFEDILIDMNGFLKIFKSPGINNNEPIYINEGAVIQTGGQSFDIEINGVDISFSSTIPGKLEILGPLIKTGNNDTYIDIEMLICCYNFNIQEGSLLIQPFNQNIILAPTIMIENNASLIFSGKNIFSGNASMEGYNEGYFEIKNNGTENPFISTTFFFSVEGILTIKDVTFKGGGTFRVQNADVIVTGEENITLDNVDIWIQPTTGTLTLGTGNPFSVNLINGSQIRNGGELFLNGANIIGSGSSAEEQLINSGVFTVLNSTIQHEFNGIYFKNIEILNLNEGAIILDDNSSFENHFYQDPDYPDYIEYGKIIGSGLFKFPEYNPANIHNNGIFDPSPGINNLNTINYSQNSTALILIDIDGTSPGEYDTITNTGETNFEGGFIVNLNFEANIGDEFMVYTSIEALSECNPVSTTSAIYNGFEYVFDVICNDTNIVLKLNNIILNTEDNIITNTPFFVIPNPAIEVITFEYPASIFEDYDQLEIEIYTSLKQKIATIPLREKTTTFDVSHLSSGVYFARLNSEERTIAITKIVLK
ncbi:MAG: T9SS type A sorting domain-containing protein [Flavobacteriaceae bacterium]